MTLLRHRQRAVTSFSPHPDNRTHLIPSRGVREVVLADLADARDNWNEQSNFPSSVELVGATPNEGLRFTVLRGEPLVENGVRAELVLPFTMLATPDKTYRIRVDVTYPTLSVHRRTMFQYLSTDELLGTPLDFQTRFGDVRVSWLPPGGDPPDSIPREEIILPAALNTVATIILAPDSFSVNGQVIRNYGLHRGITQYFKFGIYTGPYVDWPGGDDEDWSQHNSIRIDVIG